MSGAPGARGRRPGRPDTRAEILDAARALFAERGFSGTTVRGVAAAAGVDASLVHHYFGSKDDLFVAALELRADPRAILPAVLADGPDGVGERLVRTFLAVWDDEENRRPLLALVRGVLEPEGGRLLRDGVARMVLTPVGEALGLDQRERRVALLASQLMGVVMTRYLLAIEPLASTPAEELVPVYGPIVQRLLTEPLP